MFRAYINNLMSHAIARKVHVMLIRELVKIWDRGHCRLRVKKNGILFHRNSAPLPNFVNICATSNSTYLDTPDVFSLPRRAGVN